jgi:hypothetical protein
MLAQQHAAAGCFRAPGLASEWIHGILCILINFLREQFLCLGFLGFPFDHRRERTFKFALIHSRANDPGFNS